MGHILPRPKASPSDPNLDAQIAQNNAELEAKKQELFAQRLSIIKSEGLPNWNSGNPIQNINPAPAPQVPVGLQTPASPINNTAVPLGMK